MPEDAPYEYYDVKVSLSGGACTKTVNDVFFVDGLQVPDAVTTNFIK